MVDVHHTSTCDAPVDVAFAYVEESTHVPDWMFGIGAFAHVAGTPERGLGARYSATFSVKPVKLKSTVEVVEHVDGEMFAFTSIDGFTNASTWRFHALGPERTEISLVFSYELPGGLAGKALGRAFEPVVALTLRESDKALRRLIAQHYAAIKG